MKKDIGKSIVASLLIGLIVWAASAFFSFSYVNWSFLIGIGLSVILYLFNSSGGVLSNATNFEASQAGWKIQSERDMKVNVGAVFYGVVLYTMISLILTIIAFY
ncbi:hypothetical protein [Pseudalkalibacillus hwajinpoensis]|uniref:hypothetical protein n=1 Tax=Guptibacillus hwajinpoensis TaxID=208199 RepID=UPI001CFE3810|nr:hypothetical protein [Pseudalkalibacillus hwajinpoensis]